MLSQNKCIILGSGNSVSQGIKLGLSNYIENFPSFGINEAIKFFDCTAYTFLDWCTYRDRFNLYSESNLVIGAYDTHIGRQVEGATYCPKQEGLILLPWSGKWKDNPLKEGLYSANLCGGFTLSLAIALGFTEIYLCFDDKTEVFTNYGWKFFKDLNENDLILTRKIDGKTEWSPIINYYEYDYDGIMHHIQSKGIDLLVTPEHKFGIITDNNKDYIWQRVIDFKTTPNRFIPKKFFWKGKNKKFFTLPKLKEKWNNKSEQKILMKDWVAFLGLFIAEGSLGSYKNNYYRTIIYQNHTKEKDKFIKNILKKLPFRFTKINRGWQCNNKQLFVYLKQFGTCDKKFIPINIKSLKKEYLTILLKSLIFGDGCKNKTGYLYFTVSKQLADDVQEIAYKCGYNAEIYSRKGRICKISTTKNIGKTAYTVNFSNNHKQGNINHISVGNLVFKNNIQNEYYKGKIYDITVKNHIMWVRRNNKAVWSGNCGFDCREINGKTHWYEGIEGAGQYNDFEGRPRTGVGIKDGQYNTSLYNNSDEMINKDWAEFHRTSIKCNIWNVSPESRISIFPKIDYFEMFKRLDTDKNKVNQFEIQREIRQLLEPYNKLEK